MKTLLATALCALLLVASAGPSHASGAGDESAAVQETEAGDQAMPQTSDPQEADGQSPKDQAGSNEDVMKNFTRHRPGACPEGPPCNVED
ncbi:MAG: hypothetical protein R3D30_10745 [Hyphomicrobiales bacterium]